jgi:phage shock protein E
MRTFLAFLLTALSVAVAGEIPNPSIDYRGFEKIVSDVAANRESHRLTEKGFLDAMRDKNTVVLDARSASKYALRHIKGAVNLPFTDFTAQTLAGVIPTKTTRILIYCNNNFEGSDTAFPTKAPAASLNLSTYTSLRAYGYANVFELGPLLDVYRTALPFEGTEVTSDKTATRYGKGS